MDYTSTLTSDFVDQLVKANEVVVDEVEKDPDLKKRYERDMKELELSRRATDELFGVLWESLDLNAKEDEKFRWIDIVNSRPVPYRYLRKAGETEVARIIKNMRRLQLTEFADTATRKKFGNEVGFSLVWRNPLHEPTKEEKEEVGNWESTLQEKFFFPAGSRVPSLARVLGTMYEDFFDVDDITIEIRRDRTHYPIGLHLADPALWYPTIPKVKKYIRHDQDLLDYAGLRSAIEFERPEYQYMLMKGTQRLRATTEDYLIKSHFFTRSEFYKWRRGYSIMEQAIRVTTIILNAITFNAANFSNNRTPQGILALTGGYTNQLQVEKLKKILWANLQGAAQGKRLPVIGLPEKGDAKWISVHSTAKEMEFYTGMALFMSVIFALSGTNPNEAGLASFQDAVRGKGLNEERQDGIWRKSMDNGLKTFLSHAENTLNTLMSDGTTIWEQVTGKPVRVEFKGLAAEDMKSKMEVNTKRLALDTSVNDLRKEEGLEAAELYVGGGESRVNVYDVVGLGNAAVSQFLRQEVEAKRQREMAEQQTEGGSEKGDEELSERDLELIDRYGEPE
jgi:hypothetical protein